MLNNKENTTPMQLPFLTPDQQNIIDTHQDNDTLWVVNHSAGKDSQAMYLFLRNHLNIPDANIVVIHAILPEVDWDGSEQHITDTVTHEVINCKSHKTFIDMVRSRNQARPDVPSFPSSQHRQCTSDLKRDPIAKVIRQLATERGFTKIMNCMGIRAQESSARSRKNPLKITARLSTETRTVYEFYPIFDWSETQVFDYIHANGQQAFWTYAEGMTRKSCMFCIMGCQSDIKTAARLNPAAYRKMVRLEREVNSTMFNGHSLEDIAGIPVN